MLISGELRDVRFSLEDGDRRIVADRALVIGGDFSGLRFERFSAHSSVFENCDFSGAAFDQLSLGATLAEDGNWDREWDRARWPQTVYRNCVFRRTRLASQTYFGNARFEGCLFDGARLRDFDIPQAEFVDCTFRGKLDSINFWGRLREHKEALGRDRNAFSGNDFTGATLIWVRFGHIDLAGQRLPGLPDYALLDRFGSRVDAALAIIQGWPDGKIKQEAQFSLELRAEQAAEYNEDVALVSRAGPELGRKLPPEIRHQIFQLLTDYSETQQ
jgi:uncharacterized protein YjbI with pentapeptide repeats